MFQLLVLVKQSLLRSFLCCFGGVALGFPGFDAQTMGCRGGNNLGLVFYLATSARC